MGTNVRLPTAIAEVFITDELSRRPSSAPDYLREKLAIQDLARHMADHPAELVPRLVQLAMEICDADAAGVSVLEGAFFRWFALKGKLSAFEGTTTPRDFSPCGICLDHRSVILMEHPERAYDWIADANITVPEVLLVPLIVEGDRLLGTLWVVAKEDGHFDGGHARIITELSIFTGVALRMIESDERLKRALAEQETLAQEMSHRVKNMFAVFDGMIRLTSRASRTKEELAESLLGRLRALGSANALVRHSFGAAPAKRDIELREVIATVLRPYGEPHVDGPSVRIGEHAANSVALVFYELATNAAKYGAFSVEGGSVSVSWIDQDRVLVVNWNETDGPETTPPSKEGFGSILVRATISSHGGKIERDWSPRGVTIIIKMPLAELAR